MSLITSCPACGTMFRVVPDQLKISEGWVRCGHCGEVFDASAHLRDESELELSRFPQEPAVPAVQPEREAPPEPQPEPDGYDLETMPVELATRPAELPSRPGPLPLQRPEPGTMTADLSTSQSGASSFGPDSQSLEPSPLDSPFVFRRSELLENGEPSVFPPSPRDSQLPPPEDEPTAAELGQVSFVRQARRKAFWRRPLVRVFMALASVVLAALLLAQLAYQDRDRLALAEPSLRPVLERMCEFAHCTLGAPRQIESIVIDSSGFNRLRNDTYRLGFTLRNTARVPVAVPAIELTVTDAQDQPIARRVLMPPEFGAGNNEAIAPAGDWSRSLGIVIAAPAGARVAGYRLLAFYP